MTILPKATYRFSVISIKLAMVFFTELEQQQQQKIHNSYGSTKDPRAVLRKNGVGGINHPVFRLYYKAK